MSAILTTGELLIDFTPVKIEGYHGLLCPNPGGAPANVAVQLSRLGISAGFVGKVGKDDFGDTLRECLEENKVSTTGLISDPDWRTTLAFVQLDKNGDRSFTFYRNPGADTQLNMNEVDMKEVEDCSILHFGSLSLTTEPSRSTTLAMVKKAREMGKLVSYDPNWRPPLWPSEEAGIKGMKEGLPLCDIIKISGEELELLTGTSSIREGVKVLHDIGITLVIVTLGADGCVFAGSGEPEHQPTFDTKVIDTTGSGDSFWGAFLSRIYLGGATTKEKLAALDNATLAEYCRFANASGSSCASRSGGIPALPTEEQVKEVMENYPLLGGVSPLT